MIPLRTDSPLRGTPYMNWGLIVINVIVFLIQQMAPRLTDQLALQARDPTIYCYITYQFLHGSPLHLIGNMLFLYIFGNNVNDRIGNWGYLGFYLAGGVAAGIGHVLTSASPVIGASGSIAAVTGAFLVLLPQSHITILYWFILIGVIEIPSVLFILFNVGWDFFLGFSGGDSVAHGAHLSGYLFGFVVCLTLLSTRMLRRDHFDLFALIQRWNRRRQYTDLVNRGFDPFGYTTAARKSGVPDPRVDRIQDIRAEIAEAVAHDKLDEAVRFYLELHAIDPQQVLSRQNQPDIANQLFAQGVHGAAADAYEGFLKTYPKYEQLEQIQLMLGLLYARYLNRPDLARSYLTAALERLSSEREIELAREELAKIEAPAQQGP